MANEHEATRMDGQPSADHGDLPRPATSLSVGFTPGPWTAYQMTHADRGDLLTAEEIGEYVCNSVKKSASESGTTAFLFVSAEKLDGPADVCHVGNGPTSPANARLIAAAPDLLEASKFFSEILTTLRAALERGGDRFATSDMLAALAPIENKLEAAIAKAEGR